MLPCEIQVIQRNAHRIGRRVWGSSCCTRYYAQNLRPHFGSWTKPAGNHRSCHFQTGISISYSPGALRCGEPAFSVSKFIKGYSFHCRYLRLCISASLFQFSFLISRLQQDNTLTANPHIPVHKNIAAMPLPAAFPTITPNIPANPFPELINGSNT